MDIARGIGYAAGLVSALTATKRRGTPQTWIDRTVTASDLGTATHRRTDSPELLARVRQVVLDAAMRNADALAGIPIRLYRRPGAPGSKHAWTRARAVKGPRREWLASPRVGAKAAAYGEDGDVEEVLDHPALTLLRRPNPLYRGGFLFTQAKYAQKEIFGRAFVHHVDADKGRPSSLWLCQAQDARIVPTRDGLFGGIVYGRDRGNESTFAPDEVWYHRFRPSPFNPYDGLSWVHGILTEADIYAKAVESESLNWDNGARPDMVVTAPEGTTPEQADEMTARIDAQLRGHRKRGRFIVLTAADVKPSGFTPKDMEYREGLKDLRKVIYNAAGIPEALHENESSNLSLADAAHVQYAKWTLSPRAALECEQLTEDLLPAFGIDPGDYWFAPDDPVPENRDADRADVTAFASILSINERRAMLGYDSAEGDAYDEVPVPQVPLALPAAAETPAAKPPDAPVANAAKAVARKDDRADTLAALLEKMADAIKRWFLGIDPKTLAENGGNIPATAASELAGIVRPFIQRLVEAGASTGLARLGMGTSDPFSVIPDRAEQYLRSYTVQLARQITDSTEQQLRGAVEAGILSGESVDQRANRIAAVLRDSSGYNAERIARTESSYAYNGGEVQAWRAQGIEKMRWVLSPNACPQCEALAARFNEPHPTDKPFLRVGETLAGKDGQAWTITYRDVAHPPLHPNCTCTVVPVVE